MQIIIKIPDKQYKNIIEYEGNTNMISDMTLSEINNYLCQYIKSVYTGTPLPAEKPFVPPTDKEYEAKVITRGNCMICGKELTEGLFFCKECEEKAESEVK